MPADLPALIAEGRRLIAEAMLGPLHAGRSDMVSYVLDDDRPFKNIYGPDSPPDDIARVWGEQCIARAQLLALAANHLPALLDVAEAADKVHDAMEAYQETSGYHSYRALLDAHAALDSALSRLRGVR